MKKVKFNLLFSSFLTLLGLSLSSCDAGFIKLDRYKYDVLDNDTHEVVQGDNFEKNGKYESLHYFSESGEGEIEDFYSMFKSKNDSIPSTGIRPLIVVPVEFSDYPKSKLKFSSSDARKIIENAFFGTENVNQYESVASFYDKSSYGKLKLKGFVTDWYTAKQSVQELEGHKDHVTGIYLNVCEMIKTNYKEELKEVYDESKDDFLLPVFMIYTLPHKTYDDVFWAYAVNGRPAYQGGTKHVIYAWASFSFLNVQFGKPDAHTLIHETGHLLGLVDYYAKPNEKKDKNKQIDMLTGRIDMMDCSIGDHTGYSKMLLNWTRPYFVTGNTSITIHPFTSTGDLILLNDNWNKSPMDEYLLIEFYSPLGLNSYDVNQKNASASLPKKPGIKVYHVASKVFVNAKDEDNNDVNKFLSSFSNADPVPKNHTFEIANSNYEPTSCTDGKPLYKLLEVSGKNTYGIGQGPLATDETLFHENDTFGYETYKDYRFYDSEKLGYKFKVEKLTNFEATLTFEKAN